MAKVSGLPDNENASETTIVENADDEQNREHFSRIRERRDGIDAGSHNSIRDISCIISADASPRFGHQTDTMSDVVAAAAAAAVRKISQHASAMSRLLRI